MSLLEQRQRRMPVRQDSPVTVAQIDEFDDVLDVRSPAEFAIDHVPGAGSFPVLDNDERARVGTMYVQVSPFEARKLGAALVARNIARHIEAAFAAHPVTWRPLVYCWRGGKRSGAMTHVLRDIGWRAGQLEGGYQSYRRAVVADLATLPQQFTLRVICGPTGSGKSGLLAALREQGAQVLDLEGLARHRGSVLGALPGDPQPTQKMFDSLLWNTLRRLDSSRPVYVESESRKIGLVQLPTALLEHMRAAGCVRVEPPLEERVRFLVQEYQHCIANPDWLRARLGLLVELQPKIVMAHWMECIDRGAWDELVTDLLVRHYDPLYRRSMSRNFKAMEAAPVLRPPKLDIPGLAVSAGELLGSTQDRQDALAI